MKFNVTKKENELYEKLDKLVNEFQENGQTIYASFAIGKDMGGMLFCGDEWKLIEGFYNLLKNGLSFDACETDRRLAFALFCGMQEIVEDGGTIEKNLVKSISWIWSMADYGDEKDEKDEKIEIDVTDKNDKMAETKEETLEELAAKLDKMGYYVSKKPHKTSNKETKKDK